MSDAARSRPLATILANRRMIGLSYRLLAVIAVLSVVTGLGQALLLLFVVRAATALADEVDSVSGDLGPLASVDLSVTELLLLAGGVLVAVLIAEVLNSWTQATLQASAQRTARTRLLDRYSAASFAAQTELPRGEMQHIIIAQTNQASGLVNEVSTALTAIINFVALVGSAVILSPGAAATVLGGLGVLFLALRPLLSRTRKSGADQAWAQRGMGAELIERLELSREVRAFGVDAQAAAIVKERIDEVAAVQRRLRFISRMNSVLYRMGAFGLVIAMLAAVQSIGSTNLTALTGALLMLLRSLSYGQAAQTAYQRINEVKPVVDHLETETSRLDASVEVGANDAEPSAVADVEFRDVSFEYRPGEPVLHGASFRIESGEFCAIVGPSGSGKSTIMSLLLRLYEPTSGHVTVAGTPIRDIDRGWWHRHTAYVPQESRLQVGTVADAIRFHRQWITDDDIRRAAAMASIAHEIESWSDGYDTDVGPLGEKLSGGQRQRVALARALAGGPELLLLDEPTSALDPESERLISASLAGLRGQMTIVVIAHRPETVASANRVIEVHYGKVTPRSA